jgi:hypothetical protein
MILPFFLFISDTKGICLLSLDFPRKLCRYGFYLLTLPRGKRCKSII